MPSPYFGSKRAWVSWMFTLHYTVIVSWVGMRGRAHGGREGITEAWHQQILILFSWPALVAGFLSALFIWESQSYMHGEVLLKSETCLVVEKVSRSVQLMLMCQYAAALPARWVTECTDVGFCVVLMSLDSLQSIHRWPMGVDVPRLRHVSTRES